MLYYNKNISIIYFLYINYFYFILLYFFRELQNNNNLYGKIPSKKYQRIYIYLKK